MIQPPGSVLCGLKINPLKGTSTSGEYQLFKALHAADNEIISSWAARSVRHDLNYCTSTHLIPVAI